MKKTVKKRNPPWTYDELVLAMDLYVRRGLPSASDPDVVELSRLLNRLQANQEEGSLPSFRNPNGVYLKMCNFRAKEFPGQGMAHGSHLEFDVWDRFASRRDELHQLANSIRSRGHLLPPVDPRPLGRKAATRVAGLADLTRSTPNSHGDPPRQAMVLLMELVREAGALGGRLASAEAGGEGALSSDVLRGRLSTMLSLLAEMMDGLEAGLPSAQSAAREQDSRPDLASPTLGDVGKLLIFPCGDQSSIKHFNRTVRRPVDLTALGLNLDQLSSVTPSDYPWSEARVWGIMPRGTGLNESRFRRCGAGDVGLFTGGGRAFSAAIVQATFQSEELARTLWHTDGSGRTWELIFLLSKPIELQIPYEVLNKAIGYDPKFAFQSFFVLPGPTTQRARQALDQDIGILWGGQR